MKKTIFGCALMICGVIASCTEYLAQQILFAAPNVTAGNSYLLLWGGPILMIVGLVFCIAGLTEKVTDDE